MFHSQNKSGNRQASIDQEDLKDDTDDFQEVDNPSSQQTKRTANIRIYVRIYVLKLVMVAALEVGIPFQNQQAMM